MSYLYTTFDGVALPLYDHSQSHDMMPSEPTLLDSVGGAYDWVGTGRRKGRKQTLSLTGVYIGELTYLVDDAGNYLVDDVGDFLISGDSETMARSQIAELMAKKGTRGQLFRKRLDDAVLEWKTARLLSVSWQRKWEDHAVKAELTCQFESRMEYWHAATATTTSGNATASVALPVMVENTGEQVEDATITVTRTSGTITVVSLVCAELGIALEWAGSLGASEVLTIDCDAQTVKKNTTDSFGGFTLTPVYHTAAGWLPIPKGSYLFSATVVGGNATVAISHYTQFP